MTLYCHNIHKILADFDVIHTLSWRACKKFDRESFSNTVEMLTKLVMCHGDNKRIQYLTKAKGRKREKESENIK